LEPALLPECPWLSLPLAELPFFFLCSPFFFLAVFLAGFHFLAAYEMYEPKIGQRQAISCLARLAFSFPSFLIMLHDNDVVCLMMLLLLLLGLELETSKFDLLWQLEEHQTQPGFKPLPMLKEKLNSF